MRAIDIKDGKGPIENLFLNEDVPTPEAKEQQALVKIVAFGLNRMDLYQREGKYKVPEAGGKILGVEFSGTIEKLGPNTESSGFKVGDEVFGLAYGSAYAEYIAASVKMLIHKPSHLSWEEAAGVPETWMTATQALYLVGNYEPGNSVLWHAGASSVSIAGIQIAAQDGASAIYATASSQDKLDFCKSIGATHVFNYKTQDWSKELLVASEDMGVDVIVDFIGQNYLAGNLAAAAMDGRIVQLASMSGSTLKADTDYSPLENKRLKWEGSRLRSRDVKYQEKLRDMLVEKVLPKFENGKFKVFVEKVFDWKDIQDAHKLMESNKTKGKIICLVK